MTQQYLRLLRRLWLAEQMQAIAAEQRALPLPPPAPTGYPPTPEALQAAHDAMEAYCAAWDRLQAQYLWHAEEVLENIRCDGMLRPLHPAELAFIAEYDQWKQRVAEMMAEDQGIAEKTRASARRAGLRA